MGNAIFFIAALLFGYRIFTEKPGKKLFWYFAGILFFPSAIVLITTPLISFERFIIFCMLIVVLSDASLRKDLKTFPLKWVLIILFFLLLGVGIFDDRINLFQQVYRPIIYFIESFLVIVLTFCAVKSYKDILSIYRYLLIFFLLFGFYGIINFLLKESPYHSFIYSVYGGVNFAESNMRVGSGERFRISSFVWHAIYYGLLSSIIILIQVFLLNIYSKTKVISRPMLLFLLFLSFTNLVLVNSRTPIAALAVGLALYLLFSTTLVSKAKIIATGIIVITLLINLVPGAFKIVEDTINIVSPKQSELAGSSVAMRETQLLASLVIFNKSPIVGNGYNYITEDLGFSSDEDQKSSDGDFEGFESYGYKLLIEQGMLGILGNIVLFVSLILFFIKSYKRLDFFGKRVAILALAIIATFLFFIFGTGDMRSFPFILSLIGINIKGVIMSLDKQRQETHLNN